MDEHIIKMNKSEDKSYNNMAFQKTQQESKLKYIASFKKKLKAIKNSSKIFNAFYIDKNHPPNIISKTVEFLREYTPVEVDLKIIALTPFCFDNISFQ